MAQIFNLPQIFWKHDDEDDSFCEVENRDNDTSGGGGDDPAVDEEDNISDTYTKCCPNAAQWDCCINFPLLNVSVNALI